jgi:hypothetical protein
MERYRSRVKTSFTSERLKTEIKKKGPILAFRRRGKRGRKREEATQDQGRQTYDKPLDRHTN